jgi:hypothetical protein
MENLELKFEEIIGALDVTPTQEELEDLLEKIDSEVDFDIELDGKEYRFIRDVNIWDIYFESQMDLIKDCYFPRDGLPWWVEIDWDKTIQNVLDADGYGNHFSTYDGSEEMVLHENENYYIFRIN